MLVGKGISEGIGLGKAVILKENELKIEKQKIEDISAEKQQIYDSVKEVESEIEKLIKNIDGTEKEIVEDLIRQLRERGFQDDAEVTKEMPVQQDKLTIAIPKESLTDTALENLQKIIVNKQTLLQRAFQTDSTEVEITEEIINFAWFPYTEDGDEITAYTQFISRLRDMARDAKRVSSKPTETDNDKYAFRCFLLRLGFIGKEYKTARKILLRNLTGNSAFRYGE